MPFLSEPSLTIKTSKVFTLNTPLCYRGRDQVFIVPAGFDTDFATVPKFMTWLLPTYGVYTLAAILHDYFCTNLNLGTSIVRPVDADGIFRRIMQEQNVPFVRRWLLWTGVRWGAIFNKHRRRGSLETLPRVLLVSILALPFIIIPTIFVAIGQGIDALVESL